MQTELGARDVVQAGEEYARNNALVLAETGEAVEIRPNFWRIRFGLADQPGRVLEIEFDELARRVINARELEVIPENPGDAALGAAAPCRRRGSPEAPFPERGRRPAPRSSRAARGHPVRVLHGAGARASSQNSSSARPPVRPTSTATCP
ncbi:hypothetical protein QEG98_35920 [Myxococcus sp. MxC21-1]|uniref:hypothetical protein n=1 Tax=Myxococcus sp. MxC21-1 TaxID=3041439 RepID=UPI0029304B8D|nr:hypothetical protein [Myxococcus sp. MxC21-1]WNZ61235.1 hypothetical protein QEG98_35920 [Myxococcus sp. MxC21-1]